MEDRPLVGFTLGDPWGIGPEVLALALASRRVRALLRPRVYGDALVLEAAAKRRGVRLARGLEIVSPGSLSKRDLTFGHPPEGGGAVPLGYLEAAVSEARRGAIDALCTAPIHKASLSLAGFPFTGHTDFLAARLRAKRVVMLLAGPRLKVALATVHLPLRRVADALTVDGLLGTFETLALGLERFFGLRRPRVAVCGLNPHAGEEGMLGSEEREIIEPAVALARARGLRAEGPFAGDSLFATQLRTGRWDAILAMAHDQGLGPLKAVEFERAINVTLGLPLPRSSPDHGVAFDIAGKGLADPTSMIEAAVWAGRMAAAARGRRP
ncbi:MAG: 4-hydroxythreonine-4-phosphate dehydrogenase PdxA [Deltaproteobacteria bacterium]